MLIWIKVFTLFLYVESSNSLSLFENWFRLIKTDEGEGQNVTWNAYTKVSPTVWTINKAINKDQRQPKRQSIEENPATKARLSTLV
jgi:hypothetical protein